MESGAKAAISGFRRQALYTLDLILREATRAKEFQPEGKEDLAVYEDGRLIRVIQVKAYSAPLRLSDLEPRKQGSLLRRLVGSGDGSNVLELASFGPLGPEFEAIQRRDGEALTKLARKLLEYGYSTTEAAEIIQRLEIVRIDEAAAQERVHGFFRQTMMAGDPERAFDLLVWWVLQAAENRRRISFQKLRDQILAVGRYFAERAAHHEEWFTTIKPLEERDSSLAPPIERLAEEYYRGSAARYSHIRAGLDIRRYELLDSIESHFGESKRIVILHGASGQGKTSLALRYLHDYVPSDWRFMVTAIDDRRHAARIAGALADHLRVVDAPVWLFIDVAPRDLQWVALVQELLDIDNVRVLVAIREEDLARKTASESEIGFPADIRLEFTEQDAANVYAQLVERGDAINAFPSFSEAWERFGGEGPLLEFVYLVTHTESLRSVLSSQVSRLREEVRSGALEPAALHLLHICALATSFEARINLAPLAARLHLNDPQGTVALFENEFLIRVSPDRTQIEALHPVRSSLLHKELQDPAFAPAKDIALQALHFIQEADLEVFLLYLLSRLPESWDSLKEALASLKLTTWTGAAGVGRALLWWGIKRYLQENHATIEKARQVGGDSWTTFLLPDAAGALDSDLGERIIELVGSVNPERADGLRQIRSTLTPPLRIFDPLFAWLSGLRMTDTPAELLDWEGLAELTFWAGRLGMRVPISLDLSSLPVTSLPLGTLSQLSLALAEAEPAKQSEFLGLYGDALRTRFREETGTLILNEDERTVCAEFLVSYDLVSGLREKEQASELSVSTAEEAPSQEPEANGEDRIGRILNDEAVRRVEILRGLLPWKEFYCTQGHGHQLAFEGIELPHDNTVKRMPPTAAPPYWLVRVNSIVHGLELYEYRPPTWRHFAEILMGIRRTIAAVLLQLQRALVSYFEGNRARSLFDGVLSAELWEQAKKEAGQIPCLPRSAVDEWGLSSETQRAGLGKTIGFSANIASGFSVRRHQPFSKALRDYLLSLYNFFNQAEMICVIHGISGRNPRERDRIIQLARSQYNYDEASIRLSNYNLFQAMLGLDSMQEAFDERVGSLVEEKELARLERREKSLFPELWALWYQFSHHPERRLLSASVQSLSAMESSLAQLREAVRASLVADAWSAVVISERFSWKGRPALVLRLNLAYIEDLETARTGAIARLDELLASAKPGSLAGYALEYYFAHILVIPAFHGIALDSGAWVMPTFLFLSESDREGPDRPWLRPLQPLSEEQIEELGIEISSASRGRATTDLLKELGELQFRFAHLALLEKQVRGLDAVGIEILERYLPKFGQQLGQGLNHLQELIPEVARQVRQTAAHPQELLEALLQPLERLGEELQGPSGRMTIGLQDCEAKANQFHEVFGIVGLLRFMMVPGAALSTNSGPAEPATANP